MIIYLCTKFQSNTPILSKDIARKPKVLRIGQTGRDGRMDGTDGRTDSGDTICPPIENGRGIITKVVQADNSVKNRRNMPVSNPKADLHNINEHTKFGGKIYRLIFTKVIV